MLKYDNIKIGQEWYFFHDSTTYVIYKIENNEYKYYDGEVLQSNTFVHFKSYKNTVMVRDAEDLNDSNCKLTKDAFTQIKIDRKMIPVPTRKRLDTVE